MAVTPERHYVISAAPTPGQHLPSAVPTPGQHMPSAAQTPERRRWARMPKAALDRLFYRYSHESISDDNERTWKPQRMVEHAQRVDDHASKKADAAFLKKLAKKHPEVAAPLRAVYPEVVAAAAPTPSKAEHLHRARHAEREAAQAAVPSQMGQTQMAGVSGFGLSAFGISGIGQSRARKEGFEKTTETDVSRECTAAVLILFMLLASIVAVVLVVVSMAEEDEIEDDFTASGTAGGGSSGGSSGGPSGGSSGGSPGGSPGGPPGSGPPRPPATPGSPTTTTPSTRRTYKPAVVYPVNYRNTTYTTPGRKVVCVFQARSQHLSSEGYDIPHFPFPYCHLAVYCCLTMTDQHVLTPRYGDPDSFYAFRALADDNPYIETRAIVGGLEQESYLFQRLMDNPDVRKNFTKNTKAWCATYDFGGVYLYWKNPPESRRDDLTAMIGELTQELSPQNISLGVALSEEPEMYGSYDLPQLSGLVGNSSILMVPPTYTSDNYTPSSFSYYRTSTIGNISDFTSSLTTSLIPKVCVLVHVKGFTFRVVKPQIPVPDTIDTLAPGDPGPITKQEGRLSYGEVCNMIPSCNHTSALYSETITCGDVWINYQAAESMHTFLCAITAKSDIGCLGIWDSDFDDFAGKCGEGRFPLLKKVLDRVVQFCFAVVCVGNQLYPC